MVSDTLPLTLPLGILERIPKTTRKRDKIVDGMARREKSKQPNAATPVALPGPKIESPTPDAKTLNGDPKPQTSASTSVLTFLLGKQSGWWEAAASCSSWY